MQTGEALRGRIMAMRETYQEAPDAGFFVPAMIAARVGKLGLDTFRSKAARVTVLPLLAGALVGSGHLLDRSGPASRADMEAANIKAKAELIIFDTEHRISVARAYFSETLDAEGIDRGLSLKFAPDYHYEGNKQLRGVGVTTFEVPLSALRQIQTADGKLDIVVDPSKVIADSRWLAGNPDIVEYSIDENGKNFDDPTGFKQALIDAESKFGRLVDSHEVADAVEGIEKAIDDTLEQKGLEVFVQTCAPRLDQKLRAEIVDAIREMVATTGRLDDVRNIRFLRGDLAWKSGDPAGLSRASNDQRSFVVGEYSLDEVDCTTEQGEQR